MLRALPVSQLRAQPLVESWRRCLATTVVFHCQALLARHRREKSRPLLHLLRRLHLPPLSQEPLPHRLLPRQKHLQKASQPKKQSLLRKPMLSQRPPQK